MSAEAMPPDVRAARKARFNSDIIELCSTPLVTHSCPIAQGIGLYTHVAGPKTATLDSHLEFVDSTDREIALLPLGGPSKIQPNKFREPLDKELAALYKQVEDAVKTEEKIWHDQRMAAVERGEPVGEAYRMTLDTLKKKYGHVVAFPPTSAALPQYRGDLDARKHLEASGCTNSGPSKDSRVSFTTVPELRRKSTGNLAMPGRNSNVERRGSGSINMYNQDRDPRLRGR
ncbi:hypothetical protein SVAN01_01824 [Stagonosporopsis vannaccii]|nr:hypothetical protein SVAN01_01824 [Stagonosporopsis vannaccii]